MPQFVCLLVYTHLDVVSWEMYLYKMEQALPVKSYVRTQTQKYVFFFFKSTMEQSALSDAIYEEMACPLQQKQGLSGKKL